jgi:hypothetical protein
MVMLLPGAVAVACTVWFAFLFYLAGAPVKAV